MGSASFTTDQREDDRIVLAVSGEVDVSNAAQLRRRVEDILADRPPAVIVDLSALRHMDSSGLAALISAKQAADARGVGFALVAGSSGLRRTLEIRGLDVVLNVVASIDDALSTLDEPAPQRD